MRIVIETNHCVDGCPDGVEVRELRIPDQRAIECWTKEPADAHQDALMRDITDLVMEALKDYDPR